MTKTILLTGSTDGIGLLTAKKLAADGHRVLLHGRSPEKLDAAERSIVGMTESFVADLSDMSAVRALASDIRAKHKKLDVLINNAGVLRARKPIEKNGFDIRFVVNTFAPYLLTELLLPIIPQNGRVVNLSSAAQAPVDVGAMTLFRPMGDMDAYAQSKLDITIWSAAMAKDLPEGPVIVSVNPGSLLASKMVKEGFGIGGNDLSIGADILCKATLDPSFENASGKYFDNDAGRFSSPHPAASDPAHVTEVMAALGRIVD